MKYIFTTIIILLSLRLFVFAQAETKLQQIDQGKEKYEENVFNKEFEEYTDTIGSTRKLYDRIPEKLPDWVFTPVEIGATVKVVGISDPNMEEDEAIDQAVLRAKAMYALLYSSTISNITDDYTNLRESGNYSLYTTKFQDFSLSKARIAYNDSLIHVVDTFFTKYNEGIVVIEFSNQLDTLQKPDTLDVKAEHLQIFIEKSFRKEKIEFFNFSVRDDLAKNDSVDFLAQYNYKVVNRGYDIHSVFGNKTIEFLERTYNYVPEQDFEKDSTDSELNTFRLTRGLWNGYISGILNNITVLSKQLASHVKNSNDFYTLKTEGLIRTVARNKVSFEFGEFKMYENQFYIRLNGEIRN